MMKKSSSSENEPCCSKDCKKNTDSLNNKIKELKSELSESNNYLYHYKLRVAQFEERLKEYKEREATYIVKIRTLEMYRASDLDSIKILTNEDEDDKEHLALTDSIVVIPTNELVSPPEGTKYVIPPPSTDIATTRARITIRLQAAISFPPEAEVERFLAMPIPSPSPLA
nr:hypothetical protein [Tanacetum cinerariifolium]